MKHWTSLTIMAVVILFGCSKVEDPTSIPLDQIIAVRVTGPNSIVADGAATTTLEAMIPAEATGTNRTVKFATTRGSFQGTDGKQEVSVTVDTQGIAHATLIAGRDPAVANVSATAGTYTSSVSVTLTRAYATSILAETNSASVSQDGKTKPTITAILSRAVGQVSPNTPVTFEAFQARSDGSRVSVGRFFSITSTDANGKATANFAGDTGDVLKDVPVIIRMTTPADTGSISTELSLRVTETG